MGYEAWANTKPRVAKYAPSIAEIAPRRAPLFKIINYSGECRSVNRRHSILLVFIAERQNETCRQGGLLEEMLEA